MTKEKITIKDFLNKILNGAATGIVVGLLPNAILGEIFKALANVHPIFALFAQVLQSIQFTVPLLVGIFTALQFGYSGIPMASLAAAAFAGSGVAKFTQTGENMGFVFNGTGDLINTMLTLIVAVSILRWYGNRLPSLTIVLVPILVGAVSGFIGQLTLPYVSQFTAWIGVLINSFTTLQPLLMMILISVAFALIIVSPLSTVAIAYAISISGLAAGAANVGIVATVFTLAYGSSKVNNAGTTIALFFGGPKLMMANYLQNPKMNIPLIANAIVSGIAAYIFNIQVTTAAAGFGITGLAGPINAFSFLEGSLVVKLLIVIIQFIVVPLASAVITHELFTKLGLYSNDIFVNNPNKKA